MATTGYFKGITDKQKEDQKIRIKKLVDRWIRPIGLGWWKIDFDYNETITDGTLEDNFALFATCDVKWEYNTALISVNLSQIMCIDDEALELTFVHELMHIFLAEMRDIQKDQKHEERVATNLAQAFIWAVNNVKKIKEKNVKHTKPKKLLRPLRGRTRTGNVQSDRGRK